MFPSFSSRVRFFFELFFALPVFPLPFMGRALPGKVMRRFVFFGSFPSLVPGIDRSRGSFFACAVVPPGVFFLKEQLPGKGPTPYSLFPAP